MIAALAACITYAGEAMGKPAVHYAHVTHSRTYSCHVVPPSAFQDSVCYCGFACWRTRINKSANTNMNKLLEGNYCNRILPLYLFSLQ